MSHGEIAARVRATDWATHALGPMESWPAALRAALTTCLAARSPMQLWWGAATTLFYNDAFIPWLGERHPCALGARAAEIYRTRWPTLGAAVQRVFVHRDAVEAEGLLLTPITVGSTSVEGVICTFALDRVGDDVLVDVDHALRRPLNALAQLATAPSHDSSVQQLARAVDDLLDIARLGRGRLRLERVPSGIVDIVGDAVRATGLAVTVSARTEGATVLADRPRLGRALAMLLGCTRPTTITVDSVEGGVQITLAGSAPARPADYAPARRLIELHGGLVHDREGHYIVELPTTETSGANRESRTCRVLIVEDDDVSARTTQMVLEQLGYVVAIAHDGAVALEVARVFRPDIALIDIQLPIIDGWEVARRLREKLGNLPVVAVTGYGGEEEQRRSRDAGFADHFRKPIDLDALDRCLGDLRARVS